MVSGMNARRLAADLFEQGATQAEVARRIGVSRVTALQWHRIWRTRGRTGLLTRARRGRRPKLDSSQLATIDAALLRSPRSWGYALDDWSLSAIAALIRKLTGVVHHPRHVGRLLRRMGWIVPPLRGLREDALRLRLLGDHDGNRICLLEGHAAREA